MNTSNISSSSTSSLTSIMIITPPYSGKDVVNTSSSTACINHPKHIKQARQVSWGLSDEIIVVRNDDDNVENQKDIATTAVSDSGSMVMFPNLSIERHDVFTMSTHFSNSARIDGRTGNCSSGSNNNNNVAGTATTYHELEEQYRLYPRQSPPTEQSDTRFMTFPFHGFINFRTKGDVDDDDSSCFTDIKDDEMGNMDEDKNRHDLDDFHRSAYHQHGGILYDNVNDDDDPDDDDILQTPDHTLHYYYNPNSQQRYPSS